MAIGDRIKRARNFRGMTQKELGMAVGLDEKSADIRIAQYESGTRTPKESPEEDCRGAGCELSLSVRVPSACGGRYHVCFVRAGRALPSYFSL